MESPFPLAEAAFAKAACSAAIAIGGDASGILVAWPSVAGRPRRGPRASTTSSKGVVATIPDAFARSSAPSPSAAFAAAIIGARHFDVASLARDAREASLSAGDDVHPPSPEPRFDPRLSSTMRIGARISLRAFLQSSFQSASNDRVRSRPACQLLFMQLTSSYEETAAGSFRSGPSIVSPGAERLAPLDRFPISPLARRRRQIFATPTNRSTSTLRRAARRREEIEISALHTRFAEELPSRARPRSLARVFRSRVLSSKKNHRWEPFIHKLITACGWIEGPLLENASNGAIALFSPRAPAFS